MAKGQLAVLEKLCCSSGNQIQNSAILIRNELCTGVDLKLPPKTPRVQRIQVSPNIGSSKISKLVQWISDILWLINIQIEKYSRGDACS